MFATCPGSKRILATQVESLSWKFAQESTQSFTLRAPVKLRSLSAAVAETFALLPWSKFVPSGPVVAGKTPHISLHSAGDQAFKTAAGSDSGWALALMHESQSLHQPWTFL